MKYILLLLSISLIFSNRIINEKFVSELKKKAPFEVYDVETNPFRDYTDEEIKSMLGDFKTSKNLRSYKRKQGKRVLQDLPETYDFRKQFPKCAGPIKDQGECGGCWAFAGTASLEHRFCQFYNQTYVESLSPQYLISCDGGSKGCLGGYRDKTWEGFRKYGCVSERCFPYTSQKGYAEPCSNKCTVEGEEWISHYVDEYYQMTTVNEIKADLVAYGPIHTGFEVWSDFMSYKGGIYEFTHGNYLGNHAVSIVGYGIEEGKEFWICQNSWNADWGESGYFRIKQGECLIDDDTWAGTVWPLDNKH